MKTTDIIICAIVLVAAIGGGFAYVSVYSHASQPPRPCSIVTSGGQTIPGKVILLGKGGEIVERYCIPLFQNG